MSITEVAKAAGVSTATVSRVLNGLPGVREETIAQVKAAVKELKYTRQRSRPVRRRVPSAASKLKTGSIAVITLGHDRSWLERPVMASVLGGIQRSTQGLDLRLILGEMADLTKPIPLLTGKQIDGAIVFLSSDVPIAQYHHTLASMQQYVPLVWAMGMEMAIAGIDHVTPDNVGIGHLAYTHLAKQGCKRVAFLTGDPAWPFIRLRGQSFVNSAWDGGHQPTAYLVGNEDRVLEPYGRRMVNAETLEALVERLVASPDRPDGLFVANDITTGYIYPLLAQHGVKIGEDLQIVSCDNEQARLSGMHPRPPSIDIGAEEIGYRCVNRLLNRIERPKGPPLIIQVAPRLQVPGAVTAVSL